MTRHLQRLALTLLLAVVATVPAAAQESIAGTWLFTISSPDMGRMTMSVVFEQDGTAVTGRAELPSLPEIEAVELAEGTYADGKLSIVLDVSVQGQWFSTDVTADVEGDQMTGEIYVPDMGYGVPFTGVRQDG